VKERVVETLPGDLHTQLVADGEVTGRQPPRPAVLVCKELPLGISVPSGSSNESGTAAPDDVPD